MANSRILKYMAVIATSLLVLGCVKAVTSTVGLAAGVGATAVKTTASVAQASVKTVTSDKDQQKINMLTDTRMMTLGHLMSPAMR